MGYLYIMSNSSFEGNPLKIGKSDRHPSERKKELQTTGVPDSFFIEYYIKVDNPDSLERSVHIELSNYRLRQNREFFDINVPEAIATVRELVDVGNYEEKIFYRDPEEVACETQQRNKEKEIKNRMKIIESSLTNMLEDTRSKMYKKVTTSHCGSDILFSSAGILSGIFLLFMFLETLENIWWVLLIHGGLTWFFYSSHINDHSSYISDQHKKADDILSTYDKKIRDKVDSLEQKLLKDAEWHTNMYAYENRAKDSFRKIMLHKESNFGN